MNDKEALSTNLPSSNSEESKSQSIFIPPGMESPSNNPIPGLLLSINSTGTQIQDTIDDLDTSFDTIHAFMVGDNQDTDTTNRLNLIDKEIGSMKAEILPQLEEAKSSLSQIEGFISKNTTYLTNSIMIEGRLSSLEGGISSLTERIGFIETKKNINWNKTATLITIGVSLIAVVFSCVISLISIGIALYTALKP